MTPSEYRYHIEKTYVEIFEERSFLLTDDQFQLFSDMAKHCGKGSLVLDNWKIFLDGGGESPEDYFEWWNKYKPYESEETEKAVKWNPDKKSPFDEVKRKVKIF